MMDNERPVSALLPGTADAGIPTTVRRDRKQSLLSRQMPTLARIGVLAAIYFIAAKLSLLFAIPPGYATAIWPPSGIALAALLTGGTRLWLGVWLGAALANLTIQGSPLLAVVIATGDTLEAAIAADLIRRYAGEGRLDRVAHVVKFVGAIAVGAVIAAAMGVFALALRNFLSLPDAAVTAWTWWQGDVGGMIIVAPLILSFLSAPAPRWSWAEGIELGLLLVALVLATLLAFGNVTAQGVPVPLSFVVLPVIIWAALRFGEREVTIAAAIVSAIAIGFTVKGMGPWSTLPASVAFPVLLAYSSTLVITGLVLSAGVRERRRALASLQETNARLAERITERTLELEQANEALRKEVAEHARQAAILREREESLRLIVDGVKDYAIFSLDPAGNIVSWNTGAQTIKGYTASEIIGRHFSTFYTPEDIARNWPAHELEVARAEGRFEDEGWRVRKDGGRFWANVIITALYDREHRLRGFAKVTRDLTARRRIEALQETERQMKEFLAMLAHELRNPLSAIANAVAALAHGRVAKQKELVAIIDRQAKHVSRIIDDLLDLNRITRGMIALEKGILDLNVVVARGIESCRPMVDARRHRIELDLSPEPVWVEADATRLAQIVQNLCNNAAKYTPEEGRITISVRCENDQAVLRVRDNGIGISAELLPSVFDPFVQGGRSLDRAEGGLGIGLTLVRRLVELHGGSVEALSAGPGKGSEFVVRLPLASPQALAQRPQAAVAAPVERRRILVVDDNRDAATTLSALLEALGHDVRTAFDGHSAVAAAIAHRPDAVFLDIGLPGMSGYEVARALRGTPGLAGTTLVAFTGYGQEDDRRGTLAAGFDHHLVKPAAVQELERILAGLRPLG